MCDELQKSATTLGIEPKRVGVSERGGRQSYKKVRPHWESNLRPNGSEGAALLLSYNVDLTKGGGFGDEKLKTDDLCVVNVQSRTFVRLFVRLYTLKMLCWCCCC